MSSGKGKPSSEKPGVPRWAFMLMLKQRQKLKSIGEKIVVVLFYVCLYTVRL
jgi:hypothetical protein